MKITHNNALYNTNPHIDVDETEYICDLNNCKTCTFDCKLNPNLKHIYGSDGE